MSYSDDPARSHRPFDWGGDPEPPAGEHGPAGGFRGRVAAPGAPVPEGGEGRSRLGIRVAAVVGFVLVVGLVVAVSVKLAVRDRSPARSSEGAAAEDSASLVRGIGPTPGAELGPYLDNRRKALAAASGQRVAVVSFNRYMTEAQARALTGGTPVKAVLAAIPGGAPATVTTALGTWLDAEQSAMRTERDEIQKLLPTVTGDPEFKAAYEEDVKRLTDALNSVKADGPLVFGLVVEGTAESLRALAARGGADVRLLDVAPPEAPQPDSDFRGIRPEEILEANDPPTRPL